MFLEQTILVIAFLLPTGLPEVPGSEIKDLLEDWC